MKHIKRIIAQVMIVILLAGGIFPYVGVWDITSMAELGSGHVENQVLDASSSNASSSDATNPDDEELLDDKLASDSNSEKAFYFEDRIDGITIIMSAEKGVLPEGTTVNIVSASAEEGVHIENLVKERISSDKEIDDIVSFDITLFYAGEEIKLNEGSVDIKFVMPRKKNVRSYETEIYHIFDGMKEVEPVDTTAGTDGVVQIQAEHFSFYSLVTFFNDSRDPHPGTDLSDDWSGDRIFFGRAPQADINQQERSMLSKTAEDAFDSKNEIFLNGIKYSDNSKYTPIEWRILDDMDGEYLLLSEYVLDAYHWDSIWDNYVPTWESCALRRWLNEDYINQIFTEDEQDAILVTTLDNSILSGSLLEGDVSTDDKLFVPSYADMMNRNYGFPVKGDTPSRQTDYIKDVRWKITTHPLGSIPDANHKNSYYWTRSRGIKDIAGMKPFYVSNGGMVKAGGTVYHTWLLGVRPQLTLNSAEEVWSEEAEDELFLHGIRFQETEITMKMGEEQKLQIEYLNWAADTDEIHWYTNNPDCITLNPDGSMKALKVGTASITAYYDNIAAYCDVIVVGNEDYTITYELGGGSNHSENPSVYAEGQTISFKEPTKENNRFLGWYTTADFSENSYIDKIHPYMKENITLYARWLPLQQEDVTEIQYLVLSEIVYRNLEPYTYDKTRKTIDQMADALANNRTFSNKNLKNESYAKLYKECLAGWMIEDVFIGETGFYAAAFENLGSGENVIAIRGSDDFMDPDNWSDNDWGENLGYTLLHTATPQFTDAIQYVGEYIDKNGGSENLSIAGHSLGGGLGILVSNVFDLPAHTFNSSGTLDVSYYRMWDILSRHFNGIDRWQYSDYINEHDTFVGLWEKEMKSSADYADLNSGLNPLGPHGLESMITYQGMNSETYALPPIIRTRDFYPGDTLEKEVNESILSHIIKPINCPLIWNPWPMIFPPTIMSKGGLKLGSSEIDEFYGRAHWVPHTEVIYGGAEDDELNGLNGDDYLIGGPGDDILDGNSGNDTYIYWKGHGTDTIYDIQGKDKLKLYGFEKDDVIVVDSTSDDSFILLTYEGETIIRINKNRKQEKNQTFLITVIKDDREQKLLYIEDWLHDWPELQKFIIKCPVQVEVYDGNNQLRLTVDSAIEETKYTEFGNIYVVYDEEEQDRTVVMDLFDKDYTMVIKGTDIGTMDVAVQTESSENAKTYTSLNLPLSKQHQYMIERDDNLVPHLYIKHDEQGSKHDELEMKDEYGVSTLPGDEPDNGGNGTGGGGGGGGGGSTPKKGVESLPDSYPGAYWLQLETGNWKLMKADHTEVTGWARVKGYWYYLNPSDGIMLTDWITDENHKWYYLSTSGAMLTGWLYWKNHWYYLDASGVMQTGWIKVENQWYYLQTDGVMQANTITPDGYQVGESGAWIQ